MKWNKIMSSTKPPSPNKSTPPKSPRKTPASPKPETRLPSAFDKAVDDLRHAPKAFPAVSPRWLAAAAAVTFLVALACAWLTLCLLFWQGSWQLLYHPASAITRTPASAGLSYEPIKFVVTETGTTQLTGWWIADTEAKRTVLLLHGADGNLSDTVDTIAALHRQHLNVFAIDYRGYGQSAPAKPSEKQLRQDAQSALSWLTITRNLPAQTILVYGTGLGANLAAELAVEPASVHSKLAGVILDQPSDEIMAPVFDDPRSHLVPAHWLVKDRYDLYASTAALDIPSLWLFPQSQSRGAYTRANGQKAAAWLIPPIPTDPHCAETLRRWLDDLP
jgi:pimeloyl-ACP methyl ester carboxylesterase